MTSTMNLATATPAEIDTAWAEAITPIHTRLSNAERMVASCSRHIEMLDESGRDRLYGNTRDEIEAKKDSALEDHTNAMAELLIVEAPFQAEYDNRGGWTRAYKVTNSNGHIHSHMSCATCYSTTPFAWITELSGHTTDEIAELAGEMACTICYPNAPVSKPCQIFTKDEKAKQADKAEREARRAAKAAKAAANAIVEYDENCKPTGRLILDDSTRPIRTITMAKQALNTSVFYMVVNQRYLTNATIDDVDNLDRWTQARDEHEAHALYLAHNIACATGNATPSDELMVKAMKMAQREIAKWDK